MNSSIRGWTLRVSDFTFPSKCSSSSWSVGSNFTPAGSPGKSWILACKEYIHHQPSIIRTKLHVKKLFKNKLKTWSWHLIWCPHEGQLRIKHSLCLWAITLALQGGGELLSIVCTSLQSLHQVISFGFLLCPYIAHLSFLLSPSTTATPK
jgi:hypothetical protein